jgi:hypothetical protein
MAAPHGSSPLDEIRRATRAGRLVFVPAPISVPGFMLGGSPEGMKSAFRAAFSWPISVIACLSASIAGFVARRHQRPGSGAPVAWLATALTVRVLAL